MAGYVLYENITVITLSIRAGFRARTSFISQLSRMPIHTQFGNLLSNIKDHEKLLELEISRASTEEALRFYDLMEKKVLEKDKPLNSSSDSENDARVRQYLKELSGWVDPPTFFGNFEQAQDRRTMGTCGWIAHNPTFQQWQSEVGDPHASVQKKTMLIQGMLPRLS